MIPFPIFASVVFILAWRAARPWLVALLVLITWPLSVVAIVAADVLDAQRQARPPAAAATRAELPVARMVRR